MKLQKNLRVFAAKIYKYINKDLERKVCDILKDLKVAVDPEIIKPCHRLK